MRSIHLKICTNNVCNNLAEHLIYVDLNCVYLKYLIQAFNLHTNNNIKAYGNGIGCGPQHLCGELVHTRTILPRPMLWPARPTSEGVCGWGGGVMLASHGELSVHFQRR